MVSSSSHPPQAVTFGVELEMLLPYLLSDQPDPAEGVDTREIIRFSQKATASGDESSDPDTSEDEAYDPDNSARGILMAFLENNGVSIWDSHQKDREDQALSPPTGWFVGDDASVYEDKLPGYNWVGVELRSPALLANEASFAEIRRVVSLLRTNFRLRLNETTGFHVHVGLGTQQLPPRAVLRLVQLLWCADGTLSQLHPPDRMLNNHCLSIRHESYLARRVLDNWKEREKSTAGGGLYVAPVDPSISLTDRLAELQQAPNSFPALDARPDTSRTQRLPPVRTNPYEDEGADRRHRIITGVGLTHREFLHIRRPAYGVDEETCLPVLDGLRALCRPEMYEKATRAVHEVLINNIRRANYNCTAYGFRDVGSAARRMTVEFREAAGSLDPSWVAAWARTACRIVEFCLDADEERFVDVLMRVLEAELAFGANGGVSRYDVVDLLTDLGLPEDAKFVEKSILMGDKTLFWFPCALGWNHTDDHPGATDMVPTEDENRG